MHHWFKSYGHFSEEVYFAYWWSCIGEGLRLQACFYRAFQIRNYPGGMRSIVYVVACFCLVSPHNTQRTTRTHTGAWWLWPILRTLAMAKMVQNVQVKGKNYSLFQLYSSEYFSIWQCFKDEKYVLIRKSSWKKGSEGKCYFMSLKNI